MNPNKRFKSSLADSAPTKYTDDAVPEYYKNRGFPARFEKFLWELDEESVADQKREERRKERMKHSCNWYYNGKEMVFRDIEEEEEKAKRAAIRAAKRKEREIREQEAELDEDNFEPLPSGDVKSDGEENDQKNKGNIADIEEKSSEIDKKEVNQEALPIKCVKIDGAENDNERKEKTENTSKVGDSDIITSSESIENVSTLEPNNPQSSSKAANPVEPAPQTRRPRDETLDRLCDSPPKVYKEGDNTDKQREGDITDE